jgi:hypothetical protein
MEQPESTVDFEVSVDTRDYPASIILRLGHDVLFMPVESANDIAMSILTVVARTQVVNDVWNSDTILGRDRVEELLEWVE